MGGGGRASQSRTPRWGRGGGTTVPAEAGAGAGAGAGSRHAWESLSRRPLLSGPTGAASRRRTGGGRRGGPKNPWEAGHRSRGRPPRLPARGEPTCLAGGFPGVVATRPGAEPLEGVGGPGVGVDLPRLRYQPPPHVGDEQRQFGGLSGGQWPELHGPSGHHVGPYGCLSTHIVTK